jgi:sortase (surface protein transpeptidase)
VISRLGVSMPVVPTGVASGGQMALPDHPQQVGWYRYGPRPGELSGSVVLGGHVDSRAYGIGPLAALGRLERGDRIVVQQAAGRQVYRVRSVQLITKRALPVAALFDRSGPAALRILTCGGPYDPSRGGYQDNLVVTAVPS